MRIRRAKRSVPDLNTTSTADISFMLLIFFLVTTSMDVDKGIMRRLPPQANEEEQQVADAREGAVLQLTLDASDRLICEGLPISVDSLRQRVVEHVGRIGAEHVIQIEADPSASYNVYFQVQNEIVAAYGELRNSMARQQYGLPFERCSEAQQQQIREKLPQHISEPYTQAKGGQP